MDNSLIEKYKQGKYSEIVELYKYKIRTIKEDQALNIIALSLKKLNRKSEAIEVFKYSLQKNKYSLDLNYNYANLLRENNKYEKAIIHYEIVLKIKSDIDVYKNIAICYKELKKYRISEELLNKALSIKVDWTLYYNLGNLKLIQKKYEEAITNYKKSLELNYKNEEVLYNLGIALLLIGMHQLALDSFNTVLNLNPNNVKAKYNKGLVCKDLRRVVEARNCYQELINFGIAEPELFSNMAIVLCYLNEYDQVLKYSDKALIYDPESEVMWEQRLYAISYHPYLSYEEKFYNFVKWGGLKKNKEKSKVAIKNKYNNKKIRIGYVSPDFRSHTSRFYFEPLFKNQNREIFTLIAFSNVNKNDKYTKNFEELFDEWYDIRNLTDLEASEFVKNNRIDILIDCCNHMKDNRLGLFSFKPANVQITWLGSAWTSGLKQMDYAIYDKYLVNKNNTLSVEKVLTLNNCFVCYSTTNNSPITDAPSVKNNYITFGYTGRTERLNSRVIKVWAEILKKIPNSKIIFDFRTFEFKENINHFESLYASWGLPADRIIFRYSKDIFTGLSDIDLILDTFPHSGGTMLFDALWMGVPFLTLVGDPTLGRIGYSILSNLSLEDYISYSVDDYIYKALRISSDFHVINSLRHSLRNRLINSPLMDEKLFADDFDNLLLRTYHENHDKNIITNL